MASRLPLLVALPIVAATLTNASAQFTSEQNRREAVRHFRDGQELMSAERYEQAAEAFDKAIGKDRLLTLAYHGLGEANMALRRYATAIQAFLGARESLVTLHGLRERDRVAVEQQRDDDIRELNEMIRRLRQALGPMANLRVARLEARIQDLERQRTSHTGAFEPPAELSLALGSAYFRNGALQDAEREWTAAVAANTRLGEAHNNLAVLYMMTGRKTQAENALRAAERANFGVNPQLGRDIQAMAEGR
jgi:tetratricopeptide (TPR) repeat protein